MDGGIDQAYLDFFGPEVERRVQDAIALRPEGTFRLGRASRLLPAIHASSTSSLPPPC
jgi:hypothetical protein